MVAMHTEAKDWTSWQEFTMSSKFRGKYLQIIPLGKLTLEGFCKRIDPDRLHDWCGKWEIGSHCEVLQNAPM